MQIQTIFFVCRTVCILGFFNRQSPHYRGIYIRGSVAMPFHEQAHGIGDKVKRKTQPHLYQHRQDGCNEYGERQKPVF